MFPLQVSNNPSGAQLFRSDNVSSYSDSQLLTGFGLSADHSLLADLQYPQSPNSQFMYDTDNSNTYSCFKQQSPSSSSLNQFVDQDLISPSVEGLTFDSYDVMSYVFSGGGGSSNVMSPVDNEFHKSNALKVMDNGPTLTQLNTEDLETSFFNEFELSDIATTTTDSMQDYLKFSVVNDQCPTARFNNAPVPAISSSIVSSSWPQQSFGTSTLKSHLMTTVPTAVQFPPMNASTLPLSMMRQPVAAVASVTLKRSHSPEPAIKPSKLAASGKPDLPWNWEEIESFLQSEGMAPVATSSSSSSDSLEHSTKRIKTEPFGEYIRVDE